MIKMAKYKKIAEDIKKMILSGQLKPNDKLPTELELAQQYGVSRITSREALEELEKEGFIIRKKKFGSYVNPDILLLNKTAEPKQSSTNNVGMILPFSVSKGRNIEYIKGAFDFFHSKGYILSIYSSEGYVEKEKYYLEYLSQNSFAGIIYYPVFSIFNFEIVYQLVLNNYPIVLIDKWFEDIPVSSVSSDNFSGIYEATKYLINLGHKKIAFVSSIPLYYASSVKSRFLGYLKALDESNIEYNHDWLIQNYKIKLDENKKRQILKDAIAKGITAFIAEYDYIALDLIKVIRSMGYSIPDDFSIVGFDNIDLLEHIEIPLTTVEQNFYYIGYKAAELLINYIENGDYKNEKILVPVKLIIRNSTSQISKANTIIEFDNAQSER